MATDILEELLKGGVPTDALAKELRRQVEYGTAAAASGSRRLAPIGAGVREEALAQAGAYRTRADKKAAGEADRQLAALQAAVQAADRKADREQRAADNAAQRALQRELAAMKEAGANTRAKIKKGGAAGVNPAATALAHSEEASRLAAHAEGLTKRPNLLSAGLGGQVLSMVGGTSASDLEADLETLSGNLALTKLDEMRQLAAEAGAKGSGLGQVTEREIGILMSTVASLVQKQSPQQLRRNISIVRDHYKSIAKKMRELAVEQADWSASDEAGPEAADDPDALMQSFLDQNPDIADAFQ